MEVVLEILFLSLSNADIKFAKLEKLLWKIYIAVEALPTTNWIELINKREFAKTALDKNSETFVMYVATLKVPTIIFIHFSKTS